MRVIASAREAVGSAHTPERALGSGLADDMTIIHDIVSKLPSLPVTVGKGFQAHKVAVLGEKMQ